MNDQKAKEQSMSAEARRDYHQQHSLPVMQDIRDWGQSHLDNATVEANRGLGKAINYFINHFEGLTAFCNIPGAQLDNNIMENQLKLVIRDRKNSMFRKTQAGADIADVVTSLIATCVEAGVNAMDYFVHLQRNHQQAQAQPAHHLPWNFKGTA